MMYVRVVRLPSHDGPIAAEAHDIARTCTRPRLDRASHGRRRPRRGRGHHPYLSALPRPQLYRAREAGFSAQLLEAGDGVGGTSDLMFDFAANRESPKDRHWAAVNDEQGYSIPADLTAWSAAFTAHLRASG
jgi:hypothetical protein